MKFFIEVIGCQQNEYDASRLGVFLQTAKYVKAKNAESADLIFVLACSVRQTAVDRLLGRINNWRKMGKKIYVTACVLPADKKRLKQMGIEYFSDFKKLKTLLPKCKNKNVDKLYSQTNYVPIMTGCNNFCSYCVVPYLRGREKSRPLNDIIAEVKEIIHHYPTSQYSSGKFNIILLGQNVNSYQYGFAKLLKILNDLEGDFSISFTSNHPKDMTDDVIEAIASLPKVKKEVHLPLQSGSDKILKAMNRPYTARQYLKIVENLKLKIKNLKLTTDVIVGFPGENEKDFQKTAEIFKKVQYSQAYINKYSPRAGTAAFSLGDPIPWSEKQRRWHVLNNIVHKKNV